MKSARVLIVEDEDIVSEVVERYLRRDGHSVRRVADGTAALTEFADFAPDLIVLDLMLPGMDGLDVCGEIRKTSNVPIVMLTSRKSEADKLTGLNLGADDYVTKPFSPREVAARVQAILRRSGLRETAEQEPGPIRFGDLCIDEVARTVEVRDVPADLTVREFDLLAFMARHPRQAFTREALLAAVWGDEFLGDDSTVTVHMRRLREKVEADPSRPRHLKTVWGVGYRFES
jgi:DNA-binding response OmpR family regulator